jgi:hypothetical protein
MATIRSTLSGSGLKSRRSPQRHSLGLGELLGHFQADGAEVLGGDAVPLFGQVDGVSPSPFRQAEGVSRGEGGRLGSQEVVGLGAVGVVALAEALIPELLIHWRGQA